MNRFKLLLSLLVWLLKMEVRRDTNGRHAENWCWAAGRTLFLQQKETVVSTFVNVTKIPEQTAYTSDLLYFVALDVSAHCAQGVVPLLTS